MRRLSFPEKEKEVLMTRDRYYVVLHDGQWKIKHGDDHSHPYSTQQEAIDSAIDAAQHAKQRGVPSQVLVQGEDMSFRTEWTYGEDPYPPAG
jgi:Uncharacterized protein conserved in bacteria (DUF2188)